jgi:hypothetical protein
MYWGVTSIIILKTPKKSAQRFVFFKNFIVQFVIKIGQKKPQRALFVGFVYNF